MHTHALIPYDMAQAREGRAGLQLRAAIYPISYITLIENDGIFPERRGPLPSCASRRVICLTLSGKRQRLVKYLSLD